MTVDSNGTWYWLRPDRAQGSGSLSDLKALLSGRSLPRSTLVWTEPWPEWVPATEVSVLADALPQKLSPKVDAGPLRPEVPRPGVDSKRSLKKAPPAPSEIAKESAARRPTAELPKLLRKSAAADDSKLGAIAVSTSPKPQAPVELEPSANVTAEAKKSESTLLQTKLPLQAPKLQASEPRVESAKDEANGAASDSPKVEASALPEPAPDSSEYEPVSVRADAIEFDPQSVRVEVKPAADEAGAEAPEHEATNAEGAAEIKAPAETPSGTLPRDIVPERPRTPELVIPLESSTEANLHGPASTPGFYPAQRSLSATTSEAPVEIGSHDEEAAPVVEQQRVVRRAKTALWAVSGVCGVLALSLGLTVRALRSRPLNVAVQNNVPAPAVAPEPESPKPLSCSLLAPAGKLAASVERSVEPSVVPLDETRVAVGFAAAPSEAQGIVVDVATLDVTRVFDENADARVAQVNPLDGQPPRFLVERESLDFASPRVLTNEPLTALGVARDGVQLRVAGETKALWSLPAGHDAEPQSARLSDGSYRVTLRRGGSTGELVVGKLGSNGSAQGDLEPIETGVRLLGSPAIAANKQGAAVVFAGRNQKGDPFGLRVAALRPSDVGARAVPLPIEAKEGNGAIAPALSALGDDKWLLQWTQGAVGHYRVLVQPLNADFAPIGSPVAVSPMGANAGQGVVRVFGDKALSLFVLPVPGRDELWGAVLECR